MTRSTTSQFTSSQRDIGFTCLFLFACPARLCDFPLLLVASFYFVACPRFDSRCEPIRRTNEECDTPCLTGLSFEMNVYGLL